MEQDLGLTGFQVGNILGAFQAAAATAAGSGGAEAARLGSQMASLLILMGTPAPWLVGTLSDRIGSSTAAGPIIGLILLAVLRKHPRAILMAGGRK